MEQFEPRLISGFAAWNKSRQPFVQCSDFLGIQPLAPDEEVWSNDAAMF